MSRACVTVEGTSRLVSLFEDEDRYVIPTYQRGYSWEDDHVEMLLDDLEDIHGDNDGNGERQHFFGTVLVTEHNTPNVMKIIDGQQRLTTVVLLLICARNFFSSKKEKSEKAKEYFQRLEEYINRGKQKVPVLVLSRTNQKLFKEISCPGEQGQTRAATHSKSNDSNELLADAYKTIQKWIDKQNVGDDDRAIEAIYGYVRTLLNKFVIYKYRYRKEADAYTVFNLVNNRGTRLNESDLIKNSLFGEMADQGTGEKELDEYDEAWDRIRHNVTGKKKAGYQLDRFFYHYLSAFHSNKFPKRKSGNVDMVCLKQKNLHDSFKALAGIKSNTKINSGMVVKPKPLITDIENWSEVLDKLRNPTKNEFDSNNIIHYLEKINDVKAVFMYPAILAGYREYWEDKPAQFEALVMMCFKYHVRVKVIGTSMTIGAYQEIMCNVTNKINNGITVGTIINDLTNKEEEYPSDDRVRQNLMELRVSNAKLAKALLEEAEYGDDDERTLASASIEHIMPKNYSKWDDIDPGELSVEEYHEKYFSMLGNQTLLSRKKNTAFSNNKFEVKVKEYAKEEKYRITRSIPDMAEWVDGKLTWNATAIKNRQKKLADSILKTIDLSRIKA